MNHNVMLRSRYYSSDAVQSLHINPDSPDAYAVKVHSYAEQLVYFHIDVIVCLSLSCMNRIIIAKSILFDKKVQKINKCYIKD